MVERRKLTDFIDMKIGLGSIVAAAISLLSGVAIIAVVLSTVADLKTTVSLLVASDNARTVVTAVQAQTLTNAVTDISNLKADQRASDTRMNTFDQAGIRWTDDIKNLSDRLGDLVPTSGQRKLK